VGGGSQSDYLNQRIASICGRTVVSGPVEGATLGNILIQAIAMGHIENIKQGRELVRRSSTLKSYQPLEQSDHTWERYERFLELKDPESSGSR
jgi:rhamnulokinase